MQLNSIIILSAQEAYCLLKENAILIDLRKDYETNYRVFDVPRVIYASKNEIEDNPEQLPRSELLILADNVGMVSKTVASYLKSKGFQKVGIIAGGIIEWVKHNLPVKKDCNYELRGQCGCNIKPINPKAPRKLKKD